MANPIATKKQKVKLSYEGHLYTFAKMSSDGMTKFWRCEFKNSTDFHIILEFLRAISRNYRMNPWICADVWMDILPFFERVELGLILAMVSDRLDALVDTHFDAKSELTISNSTLISKDKGPKPKLSVRIDDTFVAFPFPDRPLPNKIRFKQLQISYINHSVIEFLRSNKQIWDCDRMGTEFELNVSYKTEDNHPIWEVFGRQIWPIFAPSIRHLTCCDHLDNMRRHISPTILTDLDQLISIVSEHLFPDAIADDGPNATAGQALSKWLHTPRKNGQPKRLLCADFLADLDWINDFKETFLRATASVSYKIRIDIGLPIKPIEQFELVNERTKEKLILEKKFGQCWLLKRCPIIVGETATVWWENDAIWDANLKNVKFNLFGGQSSTGTRPKRKKNKKKEKKRAKALKRRRIPRK